MKKSELQVQVTEVLDRLDHVQRELLEIRLWALALVHKDEDENDD